MIIKDDDRTRVYLDEITGRFYQRELKIDDADLQKIEEHFENGGLFRKTMIAGLLGVSHTTVNRMLDKNGEYYREHFANFIEMCIAKSQLTTDKNHLNLATGKIKGDSASMNRRVSAILDMNEKKIIESTTKLSLEKLSDDEIQDRLESLTEQAKQV